MNKQKRRIALFGGSFNPVHNGHIAIAHDVWEQFKLDRFVWIPVAQAPLKSNTPLVDAKHRVAMLKKALKPYPYFEVSELEIERGGVSYTLDTVETLRILFPKDHLYWIIGEDQLMQLHRWHKVEELCKNVEFIILSRPGTQRKGRDTAKPVKVPKIGAVQPRVHWLEGRLLDISSTEIRRRIKKGNPVEFFLPYAVNSYIQKHRLY